MFWPLVFSVLGAVFAGVAWLGLLGVFLEGDARGEIATPGAPDVAVDALERVSFDMSAAFVSPLFFLGAKFNHFASGQMSICFFLKKKIIFFLFCFFVFFCFFFVFFFVFFLCFFCFFVLFTN